MEEVLIVAVVAIVVVVGDVNSILGSHDAVFAVVVNDAKREEEKEHKEEEATPEDKEGEVMVASRREVERNGWVGGVGTISGWSPFDRRRVLTTPQLQLQRRYFDAGDVGAFLAKTKGPIAGESAAVWA